MEDATRRRDRETERIITTVNIAIAMLHLGFIVLGVWIFAAHCHPEYTIDVYQMLFGVAVALLGITSVFGFSIAYILSWAITVILAMVVVAMSVLSYI